MKHCPMGSATSSSTLDVEVGAVTVEGQVVKFRLFGSDQAFMYTVTATTTEEVYSFIGVLIDDDAVAHEIGGDSSITVGDAPEPSRTEHGDDD